MAVSVAVVFVHGNKAGSGIPCSDLQSLRSLLFVFCVLSSETLETSVFPIRFIVKFSHLIEDILSLRVKIFHSQIFPFHFKTNPLYARVIKHVLLRFLLIKHTFFVKLESKMCFIERFV